MPERKKKKTFGYWGFGEKTAAFGGRKTLSGKRPYTGHRHRLSKVTYYLDEVMQGVASIF